MRQTFSVSRHSNRFIAFAVFSCLVVCAAAQVHAEETKAEPKKRIALLNFTANNTNDGLARMARNALELALFKTGLFDILEKESIRLIIKERNLQLEKCKDVACAVAIGELLKAQYVIIGSLDRGRTYVLQARVVDVKKRRIVAADSVKTKESDNIRQAAEDLSGKITRTMQRLGKRAIPVSLTTDASYVMPLGYLERKVGQGFGFTVTCLAEDLFVNGLQMGGAARFIYFTEKAHESHHAMMVPLAVVIGYRFRIRNFSINPLVGAGGSYNIVYFYDDKESSKYSGRGAFQPHLSFSLDLAYSFTPMFQLCLRPGYSMVFEAEGLIQYFSAGLGFTFVF